MLNLHASEPSSLTLKNQEWQECYEPQNPSSSHTSEDEVYFIFFLIIISSVIMINLFRSKDYLWNSFIGDRGPPIKVRPSLNMIDSSSTTMRLACHHYPSSSWMPEMEKTVFGQFHQHFKGVFMFTYPSA